MGIFFTSSRSFLPTISAALENALSVNPATLANPGQEAAQRTVQVAQVVTPTFNVGRFVGALVISAILLWAAIWTGRHDLPDISKALMDSFSGYSGIVLGLLGGEAQKSPSG
ncbi:MAG: hypothetical protein DMG69_28275 [Acidobacteria bacterium]|nr:MAG: hypothetical protein DMG69_28275 [Acidobacteriota bacterium]